MVKDITKEQLIKFEEEIAECFNTKQIRAPIHLYSGAEEQIIKVFADIVEDDWVCCTWRNHYQCLLKGVPAELLKQKIIDGKSMVMNLKDYNIVCSSIVGGIVSIATGIAWGLKLQSKPGNVWCWVGDMSAATGSFNEAYRYARAHDLPITFIVEDNGKSVETPTNAVWGEQHVAAVFKKNYGENNYVVHKATRIIYYTYNNTKYPHAGAGIRVQF